MYSLLPVRHQVITLPESVIICIRLDPNKQTSMKFVGYKTFLSIKYIRKCCLQQAVHFFRSQCVNNGEYIIPSSFMVLSPKMTCISDLSKCIMKDGVPVRHQCKQPVLTGCTLSKVQSVKIRCWIVLESLILVTHINALVDDCSRISSTFYNCYVHHKTAFEIYIQSSAVITWST